MTKLETIKKIIEKKRNGIDTMIMDIQGQQENLARESTNPYILHTKYVSIIATINRLQKRKEKAEHSYKPYNWVLSAIVTSEIVKESEPAKKLQASVDERVEQIRRGNKELEEKISALKKNSYNSRIVQCDWIRNQSLIKEYQEHLDDGNSQIPTFKIIKSIIENILKTDYPDE